MTRIFGPSVNISENATVGVEYQADTEYPQLGSGSVVRGGAIIYNDVVAGSNFQTGHNTIVREQTIIGDDVLVGTNAVIDGYSNLGDNVSMQTGSYIPKNTILESYVFLGPGATLLNDPYPVRKESSLKGPTIERGATIGANATILPGITVGEYSFVGAGAVVTHDIPSEMLATGVPAEAKDLPNEMKSLNNI